ncbi:MFS transporter, partial [Anoxybacillus sp. EFIL]|nr:MFS transporter [Anoxybacillus sp. EFIL]
GLSVSSTTLLTATWALGALLGFALAARVLAKGGNTYRMASVGLLAGVAAFCIVIFAAPMNSTFLFFLGAGLIGFGGGYFAISTLTAAMTLPSDGLAGRGLALGAWGAAQATAAGLSTLVGGATRDGVNMVAMSGNLGEALATPTTGYSVVYHIEI